MSTAAATFRCGHERTPENWYERKNASPECKICRQKRNEQARHTRGIDPRADNLQKAIAKAERLRRTGYSGTVELLKTRKWILSQLAHKHGVRREKAKTQEQGVSSLLSLPVKSGGMS